MSKLKALPFLGLILGGVSGTVYTVLFIKLSLDYIRRWFFLIDFPSAFLVMIVGKLTGKHEDALTFYLVIGPLVGVVEGYILGLFLEKMIGIEIFTRKTACVVLALLFLLNIIPINSAYFTVAKKNSQTNLYDFSPKEIIFNSYRLVIFRIEKDPQDASRSKIVYSVFGPNKSSINIKNFAVQIFKDNNKLEIPINIDYSNSEITFPMIDAPYTIRLMEVKLSDNTKIPKTFKIEQEITVYGFQEY